MLTSVGQYINLSVFVDMIVHDKGYMRALKCRECEREYPLTATHVCEFALGPVAVVYGYDRIKQSRQFRRRQRCLGWSEVLRVHSLRPGARQNPQLADLRGQCHRN